MATPTKRRKTIGPSPEIAAIHGALRMTTTKPLNMEAIKAVLRGHVHAHSIHIENATQATALVRAAPYLSEPFAAATAPSNSQIMELTRQYTNLRVQLIAILAQIEGSMTTGPALFQMLNYSRLNP